ncbi:MAG: hypothetical protein ABIS38_03930 [Sphingomicrobium sp.]
MSGLRIPERDAASVLLVRAIESEDLDGVALSREDRRDASAAALAETPIDDDRDRKQVRRFLVRRANRALTRLEARYPALRHVRTAAHWPGWLTPSVTAAAFLLGLLSNAFNSARLNILAFPLLGVLAWNGFIYLVLIGGGLLHLVRRQPGSRPHLLERALGAIVRPAASRLAGQPTLERGVARFARDWASAAGPLTRERASLTLHLGAAMLAIGLLAGMLLRARYTAEYNAGWAGTWAGAENEIAWFLRIVLGPASALTGIALPDAAQLRDLRGGFENAGNWLVLWAVTIGAFVVVPRLLLALYHSARATIFARTIPLPHDFYLRSLLRNALGRASLAHVIPYAITLDDEAQRHTGRLLAAALGERTRVELAPAIPYGEEEVWLAATPDLANFDQLILLFSLASTPEAENHGALVAAVKQRIAGTGTHLLVLLDDSSFRRKSRGQGAADQRLHERLSAWNAVLAPADLTAVAITLDAPDPVAAARTIEQAILRTVPA